MAAFPHPLRVPTHAAVVEDAVDAVAEMRGGVAGGLLVGGGVVAGVDDAAGSVHDGVAAVLVDADGDGALQRSLLRADAGMRMGMSGQRSRTRSSSSG